MLTQGISRETFPTRELDEVPLSNDPYLALQL